MSDHNQVEVFSQASNAAIVRMPGRHFPGVVVQGDTLNNLCQLVETIRKEIARGDLVEATDVANEVLGQLDGLRSHYVETLRSRKMGLPF